MTEEEGSKYHYICDFIYERRRMQKLKCENSNCLTFAFLFGVVKKKFVRSGRRRMSTKNNLFYALLEQQRHWRQKKAIFLERKTFFIVFSFILNYPIKCKYGLLSKLRRLSPPPHTPTSILSYCPGLPDPLKFIVAISSFQKGQIHKNKKGSFHKGISSISLYQIPELYKNIPGLKRNILFGIQKRGDYCISSKQF